MGYQERLGLYKEITKSRKNPLIVYVTSCRQNASAQMAADVIPQFAKLLTKIPSESKQVDVLIVSNGGDAIVPWRIICMLRERFEKVNALLPWAAYSAATLLALGADEIIMHPFANLGPVDPQLTRQRRIPGQPAGQDTETIMFGSEDIRNFLDFVKSDIGISDQQQLQQSFELICKEVGSIPIGVAKRSTQLALSMSEKLLNLHIKDSSRSKTISEALNRSYYHHGYPVGLKEAQQIGLPVTAADKTLAPQIWAIWQDFENEMECNKPFNPINCVLSDQNISKLISPVKQVQMPSNLPPPMAQQVYSSILQQVQVAEVPAIEYNLFQAALECEWCKSEFRTKGKINAVRLPDMNLSVNILPVTAEWVFAETSGTPKCS